MPLGDLSLKCLISEYYKLFIRVRNVPVSHRKEGLVTVVELLNQL